MLLWKQITAPTDIEVINDNDELKSMKVKQILRMVNAAVGVNSERLDDHTKRITAVEQKSAEILVGCEGLTKKLNDEFGANNLKMQKMITRINTLEASVYGNSPNGQRTTDFASIVKHSIIEDNRRNNLIITGIPYNNRENLREIF